MSNGDSLDGFVFPPFVPRSSAQPVPAPAPAPQPPVQEAPPAPAAEAAPPRMTMPWDVETPIVRQADEPAPLSAAAPDAADDDEDLPWLEVPTPREAEAPAAEAPPAPAGGEAFPEWLAWDQRDGVAAEADARDTVAPIAGLEDFVPMDDLGGSVSPAPALEWAEAEPEPAQADAAFEPPPPPLFDAAPEAEPFSAFDAAPEAEAFPAFDAAPAAESFPAFDTSAAASDTEWSLAAPEAAEPPPVDEAAPVSFEASPASPEPSFEVSVDDAGALSVEPAVSASAAEPAQPFVADEEAVIASEPQPFAADEAPVRAFEPDPFTAASVAEAEAVLPVESASADSPFDDVAARLESIARMLRERPDELLAGGSTDPLALLVTGYVMGYTARGGR